MSKYYLYGDRDGNALDRLKASRPQLISKLYYWAGKRLAPMIRYKSKTEEGIAKEVDTYLEAIAFASSEEDLINTLNGFYFLSPQEKAIMAKLFPFSFKSSFKPTTPQFEGWFTGCNWYTLGDGQYITAEEPVLDGITYRGQEVAIITRNAYEAEVLNAKNMMIVDVDLEGDQAIAVNEQFALNTLKSFVANSSICDLGFRVYKTAAGLRYICTTHEWEATELLSNKIMRNLLADDRYRALCKFQDTYRARLTPKPWRAADIAWRNRGTWEVDVDRNEQFRVCQPCGLFTCGNTNILPQFADVITYHDRVTGAFGDRDLILA